MTTRVLYLSLLCLSVVFIAATGNITQAPPITISGVELTLGMPRDAALGAFRTKSNYGVTRIKDHRWVIYNEPAGQAVVILDFDQHARLAGVHKNWTPASDRATAFADALFNAAEQVSSEDSGSRSQSCTLSLSRRSPVGPYTWLRDPGKPDLHVREIDLVCMKETIHVEITEPTDARHAFGLPRVLLYESIGKPLD